MRGRDLERLLALVDELEDVRARLHRAQVLAQEVDRDARIVEAAPRVAAEADEHAPAVERIARVLEEQWVAQGPLVAEWQRAVELSQQAETAGMGAAADARAIEAARHEVEAARLSTREEAERLEGHRRSVAAALEEAPFDVPALPQAHADGRPEAARRDALALLSHITDVRQVAAEAEADAREQLDAARAELGRLGDPAALARRLEELRAQLPAQVALGSGTPPSVGVRLERAGVRVERS